MANRECFCFCNDLKGRQIDTQAYMDREIGYRQIYCLLAMYD